jgi:hypothetical protein
MRDEQQSASTNVGLVVPLSSSRYEVSHREDSAKLQICRSERLSAGLLAVNDATDGLDLGAARANQNMTSTTGRRRSRRLRLPLAGGRRPHPPRRVGMCRTSSALCGRRAWATADLRDDRGEGHTAKLQPGNGFRVMRERDERLSDLAEERRVRLEHVLVESTGRSPGPIEAETSR